MLTDLDPDIPAPAWAGPGSIARGAAAQADLGAPGCGHAAPVVRRVDGGTGDERRSVTFLAELDGRLIGYGMAHTPTGGTVSIDALSVDPAHQGRRFGSKLLDLLLEWADQLGTVELDVRTDNTAAISLYRSRGFTVAGVVADCFRPGVDAYRMRRPLIP